MILLNSFDLFCPCPILDSNVVQLDLFKQLHTSFQFEFEFEIEVTQHRYK